MSAASPTALFFSHIPRGRIIHARLHRVGGGPIVMLLSYYGHRPPRRNVHHGRSARPMLIDNSVVPKAVEHTDRLLDAFSGFSSRTERRRSGRRTRFKSSPICDLERNDKWSQGQVALTARCLSRCPPLHGRRWINGDRGCRHPRRSHLHSRYAAKAFAVYETIRTPRVGEIQRISEENPGSRHRPTQTGSLSHDPYTENLKQAA